MIAKLTDLLRRTYKSVPYHCIFELGTTGVAAAVIDVNTKAVIKMRHLPCQDNEQDQTLLAFIKQEGLAGATCSLVLTSKDYRLLFLDAPKLPKTEWRTAVPWLCKDVIATSIDKAVIDVLPLPTNLSSRQKIFAVIADKGRLCNLQSLIINAGLELDVITIKEMALASLLAKACPDATSGVLFDQIKLMISEAGLVAYSRSLFEVESEQQLLDQLANLPGEIERSFTFYQSSLSEQLPDFLYLASPLDQSKQLVSQLEQTVLIPVKPLAPEIDWPEGLALEQEDKSIYLGVYGQALNFLYPHEDKEDGVDQQGEAHAPED